MPPINCPGTCSLRYATGTVVQLTATPNGTDVFDHWEGSGVPPVTGTGTIKSGTGVEVDGTSTLFTSQVNVNDFIIADGQTRQVTEVDSNTKLKVTSQFSPTINSAASFEIAAPTTSNPISVTMNHDRSINAVFKVGVANGALFAHSAETGGAGYDTTNKFGVISEVAGGLITSNSAGVVQVRAPAAFTITFLYVQLVTVLGTGKSITFKINVNGSTSNAISVTVSGNNLNGFSTNGPLSIAQDDLICIEAATFNSVSNGTVDHFAIGIQSVL
jgi:hypothetical protein